MLFTMKPPKLNFKLAPKKRRSSVERPRNGGLWTEARFRSFIISALRDASTRWEPKYKCIAKAFVGWGKSPTTGRRCKLHKCPLCEQLFPQTGMHADHIEPAIPVTGFTTYDEFINRLFAEADGYQAICKSCHNIKSKAENTERRENKKAKQQKP